ncbi:hypothetical protein C7B69_09315 [filamentous cyanobacterium Phorm 46]|nr:hypothetical protein C7B69_09315 [filamentous cyanobacterium Phorm 46]
MRFWDLGFLIEVRWLRPGLRLRTCNSLYVVLGDRAIDFLVLKFNIPRGQDAHSTDESGGWFNS